MPNPYVADSADFLISIVFGILILCVMLRFLFQLVRADFYNPISQAVVLVTSPVLKPLRRVVPGYRGIDVSALALMLVLKMVEVLLRVLIHDASWSLEGLVVVAVAELAHLAVMVFFVAIIAEVILSWVAPGAYNPATQVLYSLTRPLLRPARRLLPPVAGIDFSPILVFIVLGLVLRLLIAPLRDVGYALL